MKGLENIRTDRGGVVLMNHQSAIDLTGMPIDFNAPICRSFTELICFVLICFFFLLVIFFSPVLAYLWPVIGRATVVAKKELFYAFPFGLAAYLWGTLYIDRKNKSDALNRLNQESIAIQQQNAKLLFFPEGTRHQGEKLLPFKKGAFHIAVQSQSAIQPVVVSKYWFLDADKKIFGKGENVSIGCRYGLFLRLNFSFSHAGHVIIHVLPEISCQDLTKDDVSGLLERTQNIMQTEFDRLNAQTKIANRSCTHTD